MADEVLLMQFLLVLRFSVDTKMIPFTTSEAHYNVIFLLFQS